MLIIIDGCMGLGKTTIAKGLAKIRNSHLILEQFEKNPFLEGFYVGSGDNALESEFTFLMLHYNQLKHLKRERGKVESICDFSFEKDLLYAKRNLRSKALQHIFNTLHKVLASNLPQPDLLITLTGTDDLVMERIRLRNRVAEQRKDSFYFIATNRAHKRFTSQYICPNLLVDMNNADFVKVPSTFLELSRKVDAMVKCDQVLKNHSKPYRK